MWAWAEPSWPHCGRRRPMCLEGDFTKLNHNHNNNISATTVVTRQQYLHCNSVFILITTVFKSSRLRYLLDCSIIMSIISSRSQYTHYYSFFMSIVSYLHNYLHKFFYHLNVIFAWTRWERGQNLASMPVVEAYVQEGPFAWHNYLRKCSIFMMSTSSIQQYLDVAVYHIQW